MSILLGYSFFYYVGGFIPIGWHQHVFARGFIITFFNINLWFFFDLLSFLPFLIYCIFSKYSRSFICENRFYARATLAKLSLISTFQHRFNNILLKTFNFGASSSIWSCRLNTHHLEIILHGLSSSS